MKSFSSPLVAVVGLGLMLGLACTGGTTPVTSNPPAPPAPPAPPTETTAPAGANAAIGVPECDKYLADFEACINKMPVEARPAMQSSLTQTRSAWQAAAATEAGKTALVTSCKAMVVPAMCNSGASMTPATTPVAPAGTAPAGTPPAGTAAGTAPANTTPTSSSATLPNNNTKPATTTPAKSEPSSSSFHAGGSTSSGGGGGGSKSGGGGGGGGGGFHSEKKKGH